MKNVETQQNNVETKRRLNKNNEKKSLMIKIKKKFIEKT